MDKLKNTELKQAFQSMSDSTLTDWKALSDFVFHKVGIRLNRKVLDFHPLDPYQNPNDHPWGGMQCKQYPDELGKMLAFLYQHKNEINSYCEIGVERFGTFCLVDSFLRAVNPNMGESLAIDWSDRYFNHSDDYIEKNPLAKRLHVNSAEFRPYKVYDFCFIDGDHSYEAASADFSLMKNYSKHIGFHDTYFKHPTAGVYKLWGEIKDDHENTTECLNEDPRFRTPLGIGIVSLEFTPAQKLLHGLF